MTLLINIPQDLNVTQREAIGLDVIQFIKDRTLNGLDVNHSPFAPYKESYKETLDYKIGHGADSKVNLKLTGEMLGTIRVVSHGVGFIKLGFTDQEAAKKAQWIEAPTGQKFGKQAPRRFFGITEKDLNKIIEKYKSPTAAVETIEANRLADSVLREYLDFKDVKKQLELALSTVLTKPTFDEIGKMTAESIKTRTRLGKGVSVSEGKLETLKPLQDKTKKRRREKKDRGKLSSLTTPARSNLTETGEMLGSLKYESKATEVRIYVDGAKNQKKATDQANQGRKFMNLSATEVTAIISYLQKKIKDTFNKQG